MMSFLSSTITKEEEEAARLGGFYATLNESTGTFTFDDRVEMEADLFDEAEFLQAPSFAPSDDHSFETLQDAIHNLRSYFEILEVRIMLGKPEAEHMLKLLHKKIGALEKVIREREVEMEYEKDEG